MRHDARDSVRSRLPPVGRTQVCSWERAASAADLERGCGGRRAAGILFLKRFQSKPNEKDRVLPPLCSCILEEDG